MKRIALTAVRKAGSADSWCSKDSSASNTGAGYAVRQVDAGTVQRLRSEEHRFAGMWPDVQMTDPVNNAAKACFGTSAVYSCPDMRCPLREKCTRAVSPWRF